MNAPDQLVLGVGLVPAQLMAGGLRLFGQRRVDVGQRLAAVDVRLAHTQQIEVGAMQGQDLRHATAFAEAGRVRKRCSVLALPQLVQFGADRRCLTEKSPLNRARTYVAASAHSTGPPDSQRSSVAAS